MLLDGSAPLEDKKSSRNPLRFHPEVRSRFSPYVFVDDPNV